MTQAAKILVIFGTRPEMIKMWIEILGLNDVNELLSRLADILNTIVGDNWWVDRDALRDKLPEN